MGMKDQGNEATQRKEHGLPSVIVLSNAATRVCSSSANTRGAGRSRKRINIVYFPSRSNRNQEKSRSAIGRSRLEMGDGIRTS